MPRLVPCSFAGADWELFEVDSEGGKASDAVPLLRGTRAALVCRKHGFHEYVGPLSPCGTGMAPGNTIL